MSLTLPILRLPHVADLPLPTYQTVDAAGMDLAAALASGEAIVLPPLGRALVPTGLVFQIPHGYEGQVRPRSGLAVKNGITVLNAPGTIDSDYRGEVTAILLNHGSEPFAIQRGMKIAQLIVAAYARVEWSEVTQLKDTLRGTGGFGSTGLGV